MEALNLALKSVARPGAVVAVESPAFYGMLYAIEANGMQALEIRTDPRTGLDVDDLAQALGRHRIAACMLMPSLQNPLGRSCRRRRALPMLALAGEHDFAIIEDDAYRELPARRQPAATQTPRQRRPRAVLRHFARRFRRRRASAGWPPAAHRNRAAAPN